MQVRDFKVLWIHISVGNIKEAANEEYSIF